MPVPYAVARFNKRVTNRFVEPIARRTGGFAVVHHEGRRSGRSYRTPINVFHNAADGGNAIDSNNQSEVIAALTYGPRADWFQNALAGEALLETKSGTSLITRIEVIDRVTAWPALPMFVRLALRLLRVHHFARLSCRHPGWPS